MIILKDTKKTVKVWASDLEGEAEQQLRNLATLPFIYKHIAVMPDAHAGKGSTVGTVIATQGAIIPAAVGVDIGCGMAAVKLPFNIDLLGGSERLAALRHSIERAVPTGRFGHKDGSERRTKAFEGLGSMPGAEIGTTDSLHAKAYEQLGSLGGGNHFIEICKDEYGGAWVVLHSGSRHIGKHLAEKHIDKAKDLMKQYFISLPDPDLAYLANKTPEFKAYMKDLMWAQEYAKANREEMMALVLEQVFRHVSPDNWEQSLKLAEGIMFRVNCHHNYTSIENFGGNNVYITRKGAVSARTGEFGIIPGSMGAATYIVRGKGNEDSYCSCSHGAGRRMSRTKARYMFNAEDLKAQTEGIECRKDDAIVDEIPGAYKNIDEVMENQKDLVQPVFTLKQLICIKGD